MLAHPAWSAGTSAGTVIENVAQVNFDISGLNITLDSNVVSLTVAERVDVVVALQSPEILAASGEVDSGLLFTVSNTGNGSEAFSLEIDSVLAGDDFDPTPAVPAIYFDTDSSGDFSVGDVAYQAGVNDPVLAADASINILLVNDIPTTASNGQRGRSELNARSLTGSGSVGTIFNGQGDNGVDAVLGMTGGSGAATGVYLISDVQVQILKSVVVADPFGGAEPVPGAILNYAISIEVTNSGTAANAVVTDVVPTNTTYVSNSLQVNSSALTDAPDLDAGELNTSGVATLVVRLGDLTQSDGRQTVTFQVSID